MAVNLVAAIVPDLVKAGVDLIKSKFPNPVDQQKAELELLKLSQRAAEGQIEVNKVEAAHRSVWVAGWRPGIGWVCAVSLLYAYVVRDFVHFAIAVSASWPEVPPLPVIDLSDLWPVLLGLLGLGGLRTYEKQKGVAR